jgi:hypothetical protein
MAAPPEEPVYSIVVSGATIDLVRRDFASLGSLETAGPGAALDG